MASHPTSKAPRKSKTIGVRLRHNEIEALDKFKAAQPDADKLSRAGILAALAMEHLAELNTSRKKIG